MIKAIDIGNACALTGTVDGTVLNVVQIDLKGGSSVANLEGVGKAQKVLSPTWI